MMLGVFLAALLCGHVTLGSLLIGSFNVKRLYNSKAEDAHVIGEIAQILRQYDISVVLEVMHTEAINKVLVEMNRIGGPFSMSLGPLSGRHSYKEHVAVIYRNDKVAVRNAVLYPDDGDEFERDPYTVLFHTTHTGLTDFAIMGVHLKPSDVFNEMNTLPVAYEHASKALGTQNILIAGDLNADCSYLTNTRYHETELWKDSRFYFLISGNADSTQSHNTNCAYDRFVTAGSEMRAAVVPGSVHVYNFETALHLSNDEAADISDHYPIQLEMRS